MGHIELRDREAVFLKAGEQLFLQAGGDQLQLLVYLQQIDGVVLDDRGQIGLDRRGDQRAEGRLYRLGKAFAVAPGDALHRADKL